MTDVINLPTGMGKTATVKYLKHRAAGLKAWETRRRRAPALKAWETRRKNEKFAKHSAAALKAWETRRGT